MPRARAPLGGPMGGEVVVDWSLLRRRVTVTANGAELAHCAGTEDLREGFETQLPDGTALRVQLVGVYFWSELRVYREGMPFAASTAAGAGRLRGTSSALVFLGSTGILGAVGETLLGGGPVLDALRGGSGKEPVVEAALMATFGLLGLRGMKWAAVIGTVVVIRQDARSLLCQARYCGHVDLGSAGTYALFLTLLLGGLAPRALLERMWRV